MNIKKWMALLLAGCMSLALCACGDEAPKSTTAAAQQTKTEPMTEAMTEAPETPESTAEAAPPQTMCWGDWTVDVPAGFELVSNDFMENNDPRYFSVRKSSFVYLDFAADGEQTIMSHYSYNKDTYTNEQEDVVGTIGGNKWIGFQYSDGFGGYGVEAYATVDGKMIRVSVAGYRFDDELVQSVLGSLQYTSTEGAVNTETAQQPETTAAAPIYVKTVELEDVTVEISNRYTELQDDAPTQYMMADTLSGGKITILNTTGSAEDQVAELMTNRVYEPYEEEINGMVWTVAIVDWYCCYATNFGDHVLVLTNDYCDREDTMQNLIFDITPKTAE